MFLVMLRRTIDSRINSLFVPVVLCELIFALVSRKISSSLAREFFSVSAWTIPNVILLLCILFNEGRNTLINKIFTNKLIVYIGNISFEFFMLHTLALNATGRILRKVFHGEFTFSSYVVALCVTIIAAHVCHKVKGVIQS